MGKFLLQYHTFIDIKKAGSFARSHFVPSFKVILICCVFFFKGDLEPSMKNK